MADKWVPMYGKLDPAHLLPPPVEAGKEKNGVPLFIARANYNGGVHPGKAGPDIPGAQIPYGDRAVLLPQYEFLQINNPRSIQWIPTSGPLQPAQAHPQPYEGGREEDGTPLYVARGHHNGGVHPGKAGTQIPGVQIAYGDNSVLVYEYEYLHLNHQDLHWVPTSGTFDPSHIRPSPTEAGREKDGAPLFIARAHFKGGVHPGKAGPHIPGAQIPYGDKAELIHEYEILQFSADEVRWVPASGTLNPASLNAKPVEGGKEEDGTPLFIARADWTGGRHPGKAGPHIPGAQIAFDHDAVVIPQYEVLCYA